ncbi:hypothetical protein [Mycobacterium sp. DBP42]|uniref:hypothetical protein n=1 Tax=Mycobacterium sp. DBP42 TaxID=2545267 RepID=UPI002017D2CC|nr:hypothetical protein [Mycobacterium sp. DBP42]
MMNTWDLLAHQAHALLTRPRRNDLTPAVTLVQSLHKEPPSTPAAICAHLDTADKVLPTLAGYARHGDRHALLMAAVLMRHPLRRIASCADPDGYHSSDRDARDNATLDAFFTLINTATDTRKITTRWLYAHTLYRTLNSRSRTGTPAAAYRVDTHTAQRWTNPHIDPHDNEQHEQVTHILETARTANVITQLEYDTLNTLYLSGEVYDLPAAADTLGAKTGAVERRAQRAIAKLSRNRRQIAVAA